MGKLPVVVFGATGFIGRCIVQRLLETGYRVRAAVRRPEQALFLRSMGAVGQVSLIQTDILSEESVISAVRGVSTIVNAVGILTEQGHQNFSNIHVRWVRKLTGVAGEEGVEHLVHISAIGADLNAESKYSRTKAQGEKAMDAFPGVVTIIRPSLVFGPQDKFFNRFAAMSRVLPVLVIVNGRVRFQPVYVGDVAEAVVGVIRRGKIVNEIFELGGPRIYSFRELVELLLEQIGRSRRVVSLPTNVAMALATLLEVMPVPPLTRDQVRSLRSDNVANADMGGLRELDIAATPLEVILPTYVPRHGGKK